MNKPQSSYINKIVLLAGLFLLYHLSAIGQYQYLSTLNYQNLSLQRIGNIAGITRVVIDNTTYDEHNERFFFQGNATGARPFQLVTVSSATGATIYNPVYPANNLSGYIFGLQYDNAVDTLYGIYNDNSGTISLSWIEPATGIVHPIKAIPGFSVYRASAFDKKNRWYICYQGSELIVLNAGTGDIVFRNSFPASSSVINMTFNNADSKLYAIVTSPSAVPQFDSISLHTGAIHFIANLPAMSFPQISAYAIDEKNGRYIFVGKDLVSSSCVNSYLYQIDVSSGVTLSKQYYPFAQNTNSVFNENAIDFCYNAKKDKLFVLNWHPPDSTFNLAVKIEMTPNKICLGDSVTFKASAWSGAVNPTFQWQVNGIDYGSSDSVFTIKLPNAGDVVRCIMTNHSPCAMVPPDTSNSITINFSTPDAFSATVSPSSTTICAGEKVTFKATTSVSGPLSYQWQVNGLQVASDSFACVLSNLANNDIVSCIISSRSHCLTPNPAVSNSIAMRVNSNSASVSINSDKTSICRGDTVSFIAIGLNQGSEPSYQWQVNGRDVVDNNATFITNELEDGAIITCLLNSSIACSLPALSNQVKMEVHNTPVLVMGNDTVIAPGQKAYLRPQVNEIISQYSWTPATGLDNPNTQFPIASPEKTTQYTLRIASASGCTATGAINVIVYRDLKMPNAFTPNGDGKNETFKIPGSLPQKVFVFNIYNRYGQKVFSTTDSLKGWDGKYNGVQQPPGIYIWEIKYLNQFNNQPAYYKGTVLLSM